jgi:hypothetical protein
MIGQRAAPFGEGEKMSKIAFDFVDHEFEHTVKLRVRLVTGAVGESNSTNEQIQEEINSEKQRKIEILEGLIESWNKGADMDKWFRQMQLDQSMV